MSEKETIEQKAEEKVKSVNIGEFLKEVRSEFLKITWPSKDQTTREFISVLLLVALITGIIFVMDKVFKFVADFFRGGLF